MIDMRKSLAGLAVAAALAAAALSAPRPRRLNALFMAQAAYATPT